MRSEATFDAIKKDRSSRMPYAISMLLFSQCIPSATAQWCETLPENTWSALVHAIETSSDFAILCPFTIEGDGCDASRVGYDVLDVFSEELYIMCDKFYASDDKECIIDCPGRHFTVHSGTTLTLDGMTLQGATDSSVHVLDGATLFTTNSVFMGNINVAGNGGAIYAMDNSFLEIVQTDFYLNQARNGGAIFYLGSSDISQATFISNKAMRGYGGAILIGGTDSKSTIVTNYFAQNIARISGPAIYDRFGSSAQYDVTTNAGCDNTGKNGKECDGAFIPGLECSSFSSVCESSTSLPTRSPTTKVPTSRPTKHPTRTPTIPSAMPTAVPTRAPSSTPTRRPSPLPSARPTLAPSKVPNLAPSSRPSRRPSAVPTVALSLSPSAKPSVIQSSIPSVATSGIPSADHSNVPSSVHSGGPSTEPSSQSLTVAPSTSGHPSRSTLPTAVRSSGPSAKPSQPPSVARSFGPSPISSIPSVATSGIPSAGHSAVPTSEHSWGPSMEPSQTPTSAQSSSLSAKPSQPPSVNPSRTPSVMRSSFPSYSPSGVPSAVHSEIPTDVFVAAAPNCTPCTNVPHPNMVKRGKDCTTDKGAIANRCRDKPDWVDNNYCQLSCFQADRGYDGDACCEGGAATPTEAPVDVALVPDPTEAPTDAQVPDPTAAPSDMPTSNPTAVPTDPPVTTSTPPTDAPVTAAPDCTPCTNVPHPNMVKRSKDCTTDKGAIANRCRDKPDWVDNNYCQLSCFHADRGYDGDACCEGNRSTVALTEDNIFAGHH